MRIETIDELAAVLTHSGLTSLEVEAESWSLAIERNGPSTAALLSAPHAAVPATSAPSLEASRHNVPDTIVEAAVVGVFHETAPPASLGQVLRAGELVGTIDALSIRNDVRVPVDGEIVAVHVEDGQPVEYGQAMFELRGTGAGS